MRRVFVEPNAICNRKVVITGEDAHHLSRSLRMAVGDKIEVCDGKGNCYCCRIDSFMKDIQVTATVESVSTAKTESPVKITVFQGLPKGDKMDVIIQKSVECGAYAIVPFLSENCIVQVSADSDGRKRERREKIAREAAQQCGRMIIPHVGPTASFDEMLNEAKKNDLSLICYEGETGQTLKSVLSDRRDAMPSSIAVVIGPEGGFSEAEAQKALAAGLLSVSLGARILRTETVSSFVLGCISYAFEL